MADVKYDAFLLEYYKRLIMHRMPMEQFARFSDYVKNNTFKTASHIDKWRDELLEHNDDGTLKTENGNFKPKSLPDPTKKKSDDNFYLTDEEWRILYNELQAAFQLMDAHKKDFKYEKKPTDFLNKYFGDGDKLFTYSRPSTKAVEQFEKLLNLLKNPTQDVISAMKGHLKENETIADLVKDVESKKYEKDIDFRQRLIGIISDFANPYGYYGANPFETVGFDTTNSEEWFKTEVDEKYDNGDLQNSILLSRFKEEYSGLLTELYTNSAAYKKFQEFAGSTKTVKKLEEAKGRIDYNNKESADWIAPKRADELTLYQQIKKDTSDNWPDYMDKYLKFRGDRLYFSTQAEDIFKAIDKEKIKPTDGLTKIVDSADNIKKKIAIKDPRAVEHFDWMIGALNDIKSDMPKAFEGALKNAKQMKALISELIVKAVKENKIDHAKTAMEVLSCAKYGYCTSKLMGELGKEEFKIFSDPKLSWNKYDGIIGTALDRSWRMAMLMLGWGVTFGVNVIRLNGSKFNGKEKGTLQKEHEKLLEINGDNKKRRFGEIEKLNKMAETKKNDLQKVLEKIDINVENLDKKREYLSNLREFERLRKQAIEVEKQTNEELDAAQKVVDNLQERSKGYEESIRELEDKRKADQKYLNRVRKRFIILEDIKERLGLDKTQYEELVKSELKKIKDLNEKLRGKLSDDAEYNRLKEELEHCESDLSNQENLRDEKKHEYEKAKKEVDKYTDGSDEIKKLEKKINDFESATQTIDELNKAIDARNTEIAKWPDNHKDNYFELMAYWDMLENGRDSHTGKMYSLTWGKASDKQKQFQKAIDKIGADGNVERDDKGKVKQTTQAKIYQAEWLAKYKEMYELRGAA
ncbi:MAG: hypothetical protein MJ187_02645 [Alphaproteobacteria bacterium]|nr:hypothetical protein [Alphaproteobacteria bacterium]